MSASWKEKAGVAALILAFPILVGLGILYREMQKDKARRKRIAELEDEDDGNAYQ